MPPNQAISNPLCDTSSNVFCMQIIGLLEKMMKFLFKIAIFIIKYIRLMLWDLRNTCNNLGTRLQKKFEYSVWWGKHFL